MKKLSWMAIGAAGTMVLAALGAPAEAARPSAEPVITVDGQAFYSWSDYTSSELFREKGLRCATPTPEQRLMLYGEGGGADPSDCSQGMTDPDTIYDPVGPRVIDVVVHILMNDACTQGVISDPLVQSQIDILNEDFLALAGTNGEFGTDSRIEFRLATEDPGGAPTTGITRTCNSTYFMDQGQYWNELAWDPNRYMNIYTNQASGALGYVPFLPADGGGGNVGSAFDRVVILWSAFGRDAPIGPPYDQGRTATHEVGHYLGLEHTFNASSGCPTPDEPSCYSNGDLICDTPVESSPTFGCPPSPMSCGTADPKENYMDYSDDLCMELFTVQQTRRQRCTLQFYRDQLDSTSIFDEGFESGDTAGWDSTVD